VAALSDTEIGEAIFKLLNAPNPQQVYALLQEFDWLTSLEVDGRLTQVIAARRRQDDLVKTANYLACRGFLRRCRSNGIDAALAAQPGWPLHTWGALVRLLAVTDADPADVRIERANRALKDVEPASEPDVYRFIHYQLGLGHKAQADTAAHGEALARAVKHFITAADAVATDDSIISRQSRSHAQYNLGRIYFQKRSGDRSRNIQEALHWLEMAQASAEDGSAEQVKALILLGDAYLDRIQDERLTNIEQSIQYYKEAYQLAKQHGREEHLGEIEHNLAVAYRVRLRGRPASNYSRARVLAQRALNHFTPPNRTEDRARTLTELATIYAHCRSGRRADYLEQAIDYARQALEVYHPDTHFRQWVLALITLGNLYCDRELGLRVENDRKAIRCFEEVLERINRESDPLRWAEAINSLGTVYSGRAANAFDANHRQAIDLFHQALEIWRPETIPDKSRLVAANWGNLAFRLRNWPEALSALQIALAAGEALYQVSSTELGRRAELAGSAGLTTKAAYCLLELERPVEAIEALEHGRARILGDILARDRAVLQTAEPTLQIEFDQARQRVRELEVESRRSVDETRRRFLDIASDLDRARARLATIIERIRIDTPDFMPAAFSLEAVQAAARPDRPIVYLLTTEHGSAAIIAPHLEAISLQHVVWLRSFTSDALQKLLIERDANDAVVGGLLLGQLRGHSLEAALNHALPIVRQQLLAPLVERLHRLGYSTATLIPIGWLSLVPLHAAALDEVAFCFAPSARALQQAQAAAARKPSTRDLMLLSVSNPLPASIPLPFAGNERREIARLWPGSVRSLHETEATLEATCTGLQGAGVAHFACHGRFDLDNALHSGLQLGDDSLRLSDLLNAGGVRQARLVVMSACQTAITDFQDVPDEAIGLPAGFLVAGASGVVGTLWPVADDASTALLMRRFYEIWLGNDAGSVDPPEALRRAQVWLRDVTAGELRDYFSRERKLLLSRAPAAWSHAQVHEQFQRFGKLDPQARPFASPFYWAAFTYTGV
jgi:CHAT domain-containing protein/TPR repeat protein